MEYARDFYKSLESIFGKGLDIERVVNGIKLTWNNDHDLATLLLLNIQLAKYG